MGSVPLAMFGALIFSFMKMPNPDQPYWTDGWTTTMNIYAQVGLVEVDVPPASAPAVRLSTVVRTSEQAVTGIVDTCEVVDD